MSDVDWDRWLRFSQDQHVPFNLDSEIGMDGRDSFEITLKFRFEILRRIDLRRKDRLQMLKLDLNRLVAADERRSIGEPAIQVHASGAAL